MATPFVNFGAESLTSGEKFVHDIRGNPNSLQVDKLFFPKFTQTP
jgi:hypothetical protein